jgi:hypothetical protein
MLFGAKKFLLAVVCIFTLEDAHRGLKPSGGYLPNNSIAYTSG